MSDDRELTLRPSAQKKFRSAIGKAILEEVLKNGLPEEPFEAENSKKLSKSLAEEARERLKGLELPNYKYVVQVVICENRGQGAHVSAQCTWDTDTDGQANYYHANKYIWCQATIYALFYY
ncbi:unnamed protein product, partial [Mesorhabditis belari]|uniref:Dynein light chain n=1 Tax=Mesorhabditis belari TaxID=2138241 RepID=A0AAF3FLS7_9BILA